ncbi:hypothetical protein ACFT4A_06320 [Streptomyces sp. NPDC057099]|uniref:hypothetical protein n=1 Tax=Streptomyces sp. NPDC057099 TaxID=3346019 RepID=UPI00363420E4
MLLRHQTTSVHLQSFLRRISVRRSQGRWASHAADSDRVATLAHGHATADEIDRRLATLDTAP